VARGNECSENDLGGIYVNEEANPTLEENVCNDNRRIGIAYLRSSGGVARRNECSGNETGIYIAETADPVLEDNDCHDNTGEDIQDER
jgi:parallel beta-helix repeat protein